MTIVIIADGVTTIGANAFRSCTALTRIEIPDSVTSIGANAFEYCEKLADVTLGSGLTTIGDYAFHLCVNITVIVLPGSLESIGEGAFAGSGLTKIDIPDSVTVIGDHAFEDCGYLIDVTIGNGVKEIGNYAFYLCINITVIVLPGSLESIGEGAFAGSGLTKIDIPDSVTVIGDHAFEDCGYLIDVTIGDGVKEIGDYAFSLCVNITVIIIPGSVEGMGMGVFDGCGTVRVLIEVTVVPAGWSETWKGDVDAEVYDGNEWSYGEDEEGEASTTDAYLPWEVVREATCVEEGLERRVCLNDDSKTQERAIAVVEHNFADGACMVCGLHLAMVTGRIYQADSDSDLSNNAKVAGATLTLVGSDVYGHGYAFTTETDANGEYIFNEVPYGSYTLTIQKEDYITNTQSVSVAYDQTQNGISLLVVDESTLPGYISGTAVNAATGAAIAGLTVYVRAGSSNTTGEILQTLATNSTGSYITDSLPAGNYTLQFVDERTLSDEDYRFTTISINAAVVANATSANQNATLSNNASIAIDSIRIVLTWGSTPRDLDSHLLVDTNSDGSAEYHVYYSNKSPSGASANLDVDDTSAYGPETVTITSVLEGTTYTYYVYNFSGGTSALADSGATVTIYVGGEVYYTAYVPSGSGLTWTVFTYSAETGFNFVNTLS